MATDILKEVPLDIPDISQKVEEILEQIDEQEEKPLQGGQVEGKVAPPGRPEEKVEKVAPPGRPEKAESREEEPINSLPEEIPAKKVARAKGRPKGALNKAPAKPRAKKRGVKEAPLGEASALEDDDIPIEFREPYEPSSPRRRYRIGESDLATEMFRLLRAQEDARRNRKSQLYASWFR